MFFHKKQLMAAVTVDQPNPRFAQLLLEQFGGATGELTAALQYWVQSFHCEDAGIKDMLQDIAIEEFSHLEMVGKLIEMHTKNVDQTEAYKSTLFAVRGVGPHLLDSQGQAWTGAYVNEGGDVVRDLRANIGAEAGARQTPDGYRRTGTRDEEESPDLERCRAYDEGEGTRDKAAGSRQVCARQVRTRRRARQDGRAVVQGNLDEDLCFHPEGRRRRRV